VLAAAKKTGDTGAGALEVIIDNFARQHREMMP
jgi:hypothetical protein